MIFLLLFFNSFAMSTEKPSILVSIDPHLPAERVIYVADVAEVKGLSSTTKTGVEKIVLSLSADEYRRKSKIELLRTLRAELIPFEQECDCAIQLVFSREGKQREFSLEQAQKELVSRLQSLCTDCIYQVSNLNILRGQIPEHFAKWDLQEELRDVRGASMLRIYFDDQFLNPLVLQGWVRVQQPVMVLKKAMVKGSVLTTDDFELLPRDITNEHKVFAAPKDLMGKELKRSLNEAHLLTLEDMLDRQVVRIGEPVAVEVKRGSILVEMTGVAQKGGKMGDRIPIRVTKTQKQIIAEIVAESRVRFE
jgi:flagella basal body P-ring formation protein FlgA